jgi:hypothetical protein
MNNLSLSAFIDLYEEGKRVNEFSGLNQETNCAELTAVEVTNRVI